MKFNEFEKDTNCQILVLVNKAEFMPLFTTSSASTLLYHIESVYTQDVWHTMAIIKITTLSNTLCRNNKPSTEVYDISLSKPEINFTRR